MMRPSRLIPLLIVLIGAGWFFFGRDRRPVTDVTVTPVVRAATFRSTVTASGEIVATRYADIGSNVMGRLVAVLVKEGDRVRAGQVLARIDPVQARADLGGAAAAVSALTADAAGAVQQIRSAEAEVASAEARYIEAETALKRARDLHGEALAPRADLDKAQAAFDGARATRDAARAAAQRAQSSRAAAEQRVEQARAQAARARDVVSKTEITSPINGIVSRLQVREGEMVVIGLQNQPGSILMTVSDLSSINAEVKVAEADVLRLRTGQTASVVLEALPGRRFPGTVVEVGAGALPVVGTQNAAREFRVVVRLEATDADLRPGLTCDAEILADEKTGVLTVPLQSVVLRPAATAGQGGTATSAGEQAGVFVVDNDTVAFTPVTTGIIGGLQIEVSGRLRERQRRQRSLPGTAPVAAGLADSHPGRGRAPVGVRRPAVD